MDFGTKLPSPIDCGKLEEQGDFFVDTFVITAPHEISLIEESIRSATVAPKGYDGIDTRGKIIIHYESGKRDSFCVGTTVMFFYHNRIMEFKDRRLVRFIDSLPMKDEW